MTVSAQETVFQHVGNGVSVTFAYGCQVQRTADLSVYVDDALTVAGFTINGVGSPTGGSITFTAAPASGVQIRIERVIVLERTTDYQQNGDFLSRIVNPDFDRLWMAMQQHGSALSRALKIPSSDTLVDTTIPETAQRADKLLSFDSIGRPIAVAPVAGTATALALALAAAFGSLMIGYQPTNAGAAPITVQEKLRRIVDLAEFGVVGDGVADDTIALQKAMDSDVYQINTQNMLCRVTSPVVSTKAHMLVNLRIKSECAPGEAAFTFTGSAAAGVALTANANQGAYSFTVPNGALFTKGEWAYLSSTDDWSTRVTMKYGELCKIRDVIGNTVYVYDSLMVPYNTAAAATAEPVSMLRRVVLHNLVINGTAATLTQYGLWIELCDETTVSNYISTDLARAHFTQRRVGNVLVLGGNGSRTGVAAGNNYGIVMERGCYNVMIEGYVGNDMRHTVSIGGSAGITRSVKVHNSYALGSMESGFDSHAGSNHYELVGCTTTSNINATSNTGCNSQGAVFIVRGCKFFDCVNSGVFAQPEVLAPVQTSLLVVDCYANNSITSTSSTDSFVIATTDNAQRTYDSVTVKNNRCKGMSQLAYIYANVTDITSVIVDDNTALSTLTSRLVYLRANDTLQIAGGSVCGNIGDGAVGATEGIMLQGVTTGRVKNIVVDRNQTRGFLTSYRRINTIDCTEGAGNKWLAPVNNVRSDSGSTGHRNAPAQTIAIGNVDIVTPADTTEDLLVTAPVSAGIGLNGRLRVRILWTYTGSVNSKTMRVRIGAAGAGLGGSLIWEAVDVTAANLSRESVFEISNRANVASQICYSGSGTVANRTAAINTDAAFELAISGLKAVAGETLTIRSYSVEVIPN